MVLFVVCEIPVLFCHAPPFMLCSQPITRLSLNTETLAVNELPVQTPLLLTTGIFALLPITGGLMVTTTASEVS